MLSLLCANWKRVAMTTVSTLVLLNVVFFVHRTILSHNCDVEALIKRHRAVQDAAAAALSDGCTFARNDSSSQIRDPPETNWCMYDDEVDLRIVLMTFNRPASLLRLLRLATAVKKKTFYV